MEKSRTDERLSDLSEKVEWGFGEVDRRFADVDRRFEQVDKRFETIQGDLREFRVETKRSFDRVADEFLALRREMNAEFVAVRKEMSEGFEGLRKEMNEGFEGLRKEMNEGFERQRQILLGWTGGLLIAIVVYLFTH